MKFKQLAYKATTENGNTFRMVPRLSIVAHKTRRRRSIVNLVTV